MRGAGHDNYNREMVIREKIFNGFSMILPSEAWDSVLNSSESEALAADSHLFLEATSVAAG
jgi:hypothetical protein